MLIKKKKKASERFFSLIFVPDQERDPRSVSMSYATGLMILAVLALMVIHLLGGLIAYLQIYRLEKQKMDLHSQIEVLEARNKKI
jgi:cell division protein FtsB